MDGRDFGPGSGGLGGFDGRRLDLSFGGGGSRLAFEGRDLVAYPSKNGMSQASLVRPAGISATDDDLGRDESGPRRQFEIARRRAFSDERRETLEQRVDTPIVETAADLASNDELAVAIRRQVERAEPLARPLSRREADDDELVVTFRFHLHPVARSSRSRDVGRVGPLCDHSFESLAPAELVERPAVVGDVVENADRAFASYELGEQLLSSDERKRSQVERPERQQIEHDVDDRSVGPRELQATRLRRLHPPLKPLKARPAVFVEGNHLAVEHHALGRERAHRPHDFGKGRIGRAELAKEESGIVPALVGDDPKAVEFELVEPPLALNRHVARRAEHGPRRRPSTSPGLAPSSPARASSRLATSALSASSSTVNPERTLRGSSSTIDPFLT